MFCLHECVYTCMQCLQRPGGGLIPISTGATGAVSHPVRAGNRTLVLCKDHVTVELLLQPSKTFLFLNTCNTMGVVYNQQNHTCVLYIWEFLPIKLLLSSNTWKYLIVVNT